MGARGRAAMGKISVSPSLDASSGAPSRFLNSLNSSVLF